MCNRSPSQWALISTMVAVAETMHFLAVQKARQMESRQCQGLANAAGAAHHVEQSTTRNLQE